MPSAVPGDSNPEMNKLRECLSTVDFFSSLTRGEIDRLLGLMRKRSYRSGTFIIRQGESGKAFYLIQSGMVSVWHNNHKVANRREGDYFGESALVTDGTRSATVRADVDTELYVLMKDDFQKILMANPNAAFNIKAVAADRKLDGQAGNPSK